MKYALVYTALDTQYCEIFDQQLFVFNSQDEARKAMREDVEANVKDWTIANISFTNADLLDNKKHVKLDWCIFAI